MNNEVQILQTAFLGVFDCSHFSHLAYWCSTFWSHGLDEWPPSVGPVQGVGL